MPGHFKARRCTTSSLRQESTGSVAKKAPDRLKITPVEDAPSARGVVLDL
jgi:hypothetical protein